VCIVAVGAEIVVFGEHLFDYRAVAEMIFIDGGLVHTRSGALS